MNCGIRSILSSSLCRSPVYVEESCSASNGEDVDFEQAEIRVVRSVVDQVEGPPKTLASWRPLPISPALASALENWRRLTGYPDSKDWVFASPQALGTKPYWPDAVLKRHILPAAERAEITRKIGGTAFAGAAILWRICEDNEGTSAALVTTDDDGQRMPRQ
jgi:hypothetical protein